MPSEPAPPLADKAPERRLLRGAANAVAGKGYFVVTVNRTVALAHVSQRDGLPVKLVLAALCAPALEFGSTLEGAHA